MDRKWFRWGIVLILSALMLASCSPAATPIPEVEVSEGLIAAREAALSYVLKTHGEQVFPAPGSNWQTRRTTPDGIVGSESFEFSAGEITVSIRYPVVAPDYIVYLVIVDKDSGFHWEGEVDATGVVTEHSPAAS